jgi:hypothetical protein
VEENWMELGHTHRQAVLRMETAELENNAFCNTSFNLALYSSHEK